MRHFIYYISLITLLVKASAQETPDEPVLLQHIYAGQHALEVPEITSSKARRFDFGFQAGSSVAMSGHSKTMFSSYIAPEIRFKVSHRFQLNTGVIYSQQYLPAVQERLYGAAGLRNDAFLMFAEGEYYLNERISLSGLIMKEIGTSIDPRINAFNKNAGFQTMGVGVHYRVTDNLQFGVQMQISDGHPPYHSNPYYRNSFRNSSSITPDFWR